MTSSRVELIGKRGGYTLVSEEDLDWVRSKRWYLTSHGYVASYSPIKQVYYLHRAIAIRSGILSVGHIDHINRDRTDNTRGNLRTVTRHQQNGNLSLNKRNKSGYKGVYKHSSVNKWVAQIRVGDRLQYLGHFDTPEEAAKVYDSAALALWGDYAATNEVLRGK